MDELETFAIIDPNGDLIGSYLHECIADAWNDVEDLCWQNAKCEEYEAQGYRLIRIVWDKKSEQVVKTSEF
jgi:hypothetical protein